ncbi:hypothetical protein P7K49_022759 [Saguinus oedipus]|uniref:Uncharacterized protein n=1 Tax=Saguinus oedipus TaxID=9490 RepID=A0ABQ9UJQ7_SAGOE|nr:hypothetical protein P7K49_022759 [Saguinus oedipus]
MPLQSRELGQSADAYGNPERTNCLRTLFSPTPQRRPVAPPDLQGARVARPSASRELLCGAGKEEEARGTALPAQLLGRRHRPSPVRWPAAIGRREADADWLRRADAGVLRPRAARPSSPSLVMVLGCGLLGRRSLAALGAACTRLGLGGCGGAGWAVGRGPCGAGSGRRGAVGWRSLRWFLMRRCLRPRCPARAEAVQVLRRARSRRGAAGAEGAR